MAVRISRVRGLVAVLLVISVAGFLYLRFAQSRSVDSDGNSEVVAVEQRAFKAIAAHASQAAVESWFQRFVDSMLQIGVVRHPAEVQLVADIDRFLPRKLRRSVVTINFFSIADTVDGQGAGLHNPIRWIATSSGDSQLRLIRVTDRALATHVIISVVGIGDDGKLVAEEALVVRAGTDWQPATWSGSGGLGGN